MQSDESTNDDPVSVWIKELKQADDSAAEKLWNYFFTRLYETARKKLRSQPKSVYDEEDAAQSAFHSVCAGLAEGRFPDLHDRDSLLRLIVVITSRKISVRRRYDARQCRSVHRTISGDVFAEGEDTSVGPMQHVGSREPSPEFAAEFVETCEALFAKLDDPRLNQIVRLRLEGYNDTEVGQRLNCSRRTVQRSLEVIRRHCRQLDEAHE